jgi:hypothetical protein
MSVKTRGNPEKGAGLVPTEYRFIKSCFSDYTISSKIPRDLTDRIIDDINQGVLIVNYAGHGSKRYWTHEDIFYRDNISNLSNDQRLPVMVLMTWLNGYLVMSNFLSSSEEMLLVDGAGAVAAFASRRMITMPNLKGF